MSPFLIASSLAMSLVVAAFSVVFYSGDAMWYRLWYYVPAAALAGGFIAERVELRLWHSARRVLVLDLAVAAVCLARPLVHWPPASGHALFCVYALLTCASVWVRMFAVMVLAITCYAKLWLWHGDLTLWSGLVLGLIAGIVFKGCSTHSKIR